MPGQNQAQLWCRACPDPGKNLKQTDQVLSWLNGADVEEKLIGEAVAIRNSLQQLPIPQGRNSGAAASLTRPTLRGSISRIEKILRQALSETALMAWTR